MWAWFYWYLQVYQLIYRPELLKIFHCYKSRNAYFQIDSSLNPSEPVQLDKNIDKDKENTNLEKKT